MGNSPNREEQPASMLAFRGARRAYTALTDIEIWADTFNRLFVAPETKKFHLQEAFKMHDKITKRFGRFVAWDSTEVMSSAAASRPDDDVAINYLYPVNASLNSKVCLMKGDITLISGVDAIVNAANAHLYAGGGVCGAIFNRAGSNLQSECNELTSKLPGRVVETGHTAITSTGGEDSDLRCKHILHTVGPIGEHPDKLASCYRTILEVAYANGLKSVAFCCVSTGIYGYPGHRAAAVALKTIREFLQQPKSALAPVKNNNGAPPAEATGAPAEGSTSPEDSPAAQEDGSGAAEDRGAVPEDVKSEDNGIVGDLFDRIVFCIFTDADEKYYLNFLPIYFPIISEVEARAQINSNNASNDPPEEIHIFQRRSSVGDDDARGADSSLAAMGPEISEENHPSPPPDHVSPLEARGDIMEVDQKDQRLSNDQPPPPAAEDVMQVDQKEQSMPSTNHPAPAASEDVMQVDSQPQPDNNGAAMSLEAASSPSHELHSTE
eukprot:TRINITY_DN212_c0_g1_i3.p1 TRINITY_DN212_c0_g1~~TRINITY_DN212_c0_g1_i3.p1  ORF type:complete len:494 (+),score=132.65 TRINITY_DN212_c0_g1_i3:59-1540(+)